MSVGKIKIDVPSAGSDGYVFYLTEPEARDLGNDIYRKMRLRERAFEPDFKIEVENRIFYIREKEAKKILSDLQSQISLMLNSESSKNREEILAAVRMRYRESGQVSAINLYQDMTNASRRDSIDFVDGMILGMAAMTMFSDSNRRNEAAPLVEYAPAPAPTREPEPVHERETERERDSDRSYERDSYSSGSSSSSSFDP